LITSRVLEDASEDPLDVDSSEQAASTNNTENRLITPINLNLNIFSPFMFV
jgi:hypothetical protein